MKLKTFLNLTQKPVTQAAKELGIARTYLHAILSEKRAPGRKLADRIIQWSDGAVKYDDLWNGK